MSDKRLRIGRIPYANLFPIFYFLDRKCDHRRYRFIRGVPSRLNRLLREGKLDISPSSSVEYLRNRDRYLILPFFSVSASGPIESILLFSTTQLRKLEGGTIAVSSDSETSVVLLKVILKHFFSIKIALRSVRLRTVQSALSSYPAFLLIGDLAMKESIRLLMGKDDKRQDMQSLSRRVFPPSARAPVYVYDLAELWYKNTGLPFVFALWIARREAVMERKNLIMKLSEDLIHANRYASRRLTSIAKAYPDKSWFDEKALVNYWKKISYDLTERHMEGLKLFDKLAKDL